VDKKGQSLEIISTIIYLIVFSLCAIIGLLILQNFNNAYDKGTEAQSTLDDVVLVFDSLDAAGIFIIAGLFLTLIVLAFFTNTHPVFLIINIVMLVLSFLVVPQLSNVMTDIMESESLSSTASNFTILAAIRDIYPTIGVVAAMIFFIALYVKYRGGAQYGF
jgi:positive regulator of sigma E activity